MGMTPERWHKAKQIFLKARAQHGASRAAQVADACGNDLALRREVESLLRTHDQADTFLERPAILLSDATVPVRGLPRPRAGRIGEFTLIREIAAGGMGVVYQARQDQPARTVALKIMGVGVGSSSAARRFEYESEILARLNHPAIAQIYASGTHAEGELNIPYFAMEYVPNAQRITEFASKAQLTIRKRLELLADVCDAVHHGHQKGVIHCDLKPSNILVTPEGQPKVIDFGVARIIDPDATQSATMTAAGQLVGTLQYMSPEQIDGDPEQVDVRSDVYALGVVLYELLCETLPYAVTRSRIYEAARVVREDPPRAPSRHDRALRGDIETIILKCLEKRPERRYGSAGELAADIRRHLTHIPIEARRGSTLYVLTRNVYRHRWALGLTALIFVSLLVGLWAATKRREAEHARMLATLRIARNWTDQDAPQAAAEALRGEFDEHDCLRTRAALWEHYLKYPCEFASDKFGPLVDVCWSPGGGRIVAVTGSGQVVCYDARTGASFASRELTSPADAPVQRLAFAAGTPPGLCLLDRNGRIWMTTFDEQTGTLGTEATVFDMGGQTPTRADRACLAVSACGRWLAAGVNHDGDYVASPEACDARLRVWDLETGKCRVPLDFPKTAVEAVAFSPTDDRLCYTLLHFPVSQRGGHAHLLDLADAQTHAHTPTDGQTRGIAFAADGQRVYLGDDYLREWDPAAGTLRQLERFKKWGIRSFSAPGGTVERYITIASGDGLVRTFDLQESRFLRTKAYHTLPSPRRVAISMSPRRSHYASASWDGLRIWRYPPADGFPVAISGCTPSDIAVAEDQRTVISVGARGCDPSREPAGQGQPVRVWRDGELAAKLPRDRARIVLDHDATRLAVASTVVAGSWLVDWVTLPHGSVRSSLELPENAKVQTMYWLPVGIPRLLIGLNHGSILAWTGTQHAQVSTFADGGEDEADGCTWFTTDARREWLAASCEGSNEECGRVRVWQLHHNDNDVAIDWDHPTYEFRTHPYVWRIALLRNDRGRLLVVTAGSPRDIFVWDPVTQRELRRLVGHSDALRFAYGIGDHLLVTASEDRTARLWDVREPGQQAELCILHRTPYRLPAVAVAGSTIAVADTERVRIHDLSDIYQMSEKDLP